MTCKKQKGEIDQTLKSNDYENINDFITFEESRINVFMKKMKVGHIEGLKTDSLSNQKNCQTTWRET
jgi:hypothetical protein